MDPSHPQDKEVKKTPDTSGVILEVRGRFSIALFTDGTRFEEYPVGKASDASRA
jgi:hypothetical protein